MTVLPTTPSILTDHGKTENFREITPTLDNSIEVNHPTRIVGATTMTGTTRGDKIITGSARTATKDPTSTTERSDT